MSEFKFACGQMVRHKTHQDAKAVVAAQCLLTTPFGTSRCYVVEGMGEDGTVAVAKNVPEHVLEAVADDGPPSDVATLQAAKELLCTQQNFELAAQLREHIDRLKKRAG